MARQHMKIQVKRYPEYRPSLRPRCDICESSRTSNRYLAKHMRFCHWRKVPGNPYYNTRRTRRQCDDCSGKFVAKAALVEHNAKEHLMWKASQQEIRKEPSAALCDDCGSQTAGKIGLRNHVKFVHWKCRQRFKEKVRCDDCLSKTAKTLLNVALANEFSSGALVALPSPTRALVDKGVPSEVAFRSQ